MAHRPPILAILGIAGALLLSTPARTETPVTIAIQATGELPGFRIQEAAPYLATQMSVAGSSDWRFVPRDPSRAAPNRIEWQLELLPYAGGEVRRFFPMPEAQNMNGVHLQGPHRLISARAKLYLDGQYQTEVFGTQAIEGGFTDPDLMTFIAQITRSLEAGYHAIDMTHAAPNHVMP
jgi:hypothetical protein